MAIGNFKRRGGFIAPASLGKPEQPADRPGEIVIPGLREDDATVACEQPGSWQRLTKVRGLGVPTATTVLAALWPSNHVIMDIRDTRAALGLGVGTLWSVDGLEHAQFPDRSGNGQWQLYREWFQPTILRTAAAQTPLAVERALFRLHERTSLSLPKHGHWTWTDYQHEALHNLTTLNGP